jgi:hypothetical protein
MRRKLINIVAVASFALCVVTVILWVRCLYAFDRISFDLGGRSYQVWTPNRAVFVQWTSRPYFTPGWDTEGPFNARTLSDFFRPEHRVWTDTSGQPHTYWWLGFYLRPTYYQPPFGENAGCWFTTVGLPFYALFAATAALPAFRLRAALRRRSRTRRGLCAGCGYDLRATPQRCPECGAAGRANWRDAPPAWVQ